MALVTATGSFTVPSSTGNKSVTGLSFQPKYVIFYATFETTDTNDFGSSASAMYGIGISSTSQVALVYTGINSGTGDSYENTSDCILFYSYTTKDVEAALVSLNSDGFTVNFTTANATAYVINYFAVGGSDLTNVFLKTINSPTSTGSQASTGVGFKPDAILLLSSFIKSNATSYTYSQFTVGMGTSSSNRGSSNIGNVGRIESTSKIIDGYFGSNLITVADLTSLDSDGFTLNYSTVDAIIGHTIYVLCLKGGQYAVGSDTQKTSTGTKANTSPGFTPTGLILTTVNNTAGAASDGSNQILLMGTASDTTHRGYMWTGITGSSGGTYARALNRTHLIASYTPSNSSLNPTSQADLSSFDATGFTLNWGTADATAREFLYLAMGSTVVVSTIPNRIFNYNQAVNRSNTF